jgi:rubrerythrin
MDIAKILGYALEREYEGKRFFTENAGRLQNAAAAGAFKTIAAEEQKHIDFILAQIAALSAGAQANLADLPELPQATFFADRADSESIEQTISESMVSDLPVLRMAYLIERDFAEFYDMAARKTDGEAHTVFVMLARWEAGHERLFKRLHDNLFEKYADMPWGG